MAPAAAPAINARPREAAGRRVIDQPYERLCTDASVEIGSVQVGEGIVDASLELAADSPTLD
jgi:hypothetical protein